MEDGVATPKESYPYFKKEITCPVCGKKSVHLYLRDRQFIIQKRDTDQYPLEVEWYNPKHARFNHLYFFMLYCPHCYFADERQSFLNPFKHYDTQKFNIIRTIHKERYTYDSFINMVAGHINYPEVDYTSAINIHLLALYIQMGPSDEKYYDKERIARYSHRLAWLYREKVYEGQFTEKEETINEFTVRYENYQTAFLGSLSAFENLKEWWNHEIEAEERNEKEKTLSEFRLELKLAEKEVSRLLDHLLLNNPRIYEIISKFKEKYIKTNELIMDKQYYDYTSFQAYLLQLKKEWPAAPIDGVSALLKAGEYYYKLSQSEAYTGEILKQYNIYKLIIAIYEKLNDDRKQMEVIRIALKSAADYRKKAIGRIGILKERGENASDLIGHIKRSVRRIDEMVNTLNYQRKKIIKKLIEEDRKKAESILQKLPEDMAPEKKLERLAKEGLVEEVMDYYEELLKPKTIFKKIFH